MAVKCSISTCKNEAYSHIIFGKNKQQEGNFCQICIKELWDKCSHGFITGIWIQSQPKEIK